MGHLTKSCVRRPRNRLNKAVELLQRTISGERVRSGPVLAAWLSERSRSRGRGWWHRLLIVMFARPRRNW